VSRIGKKPINLPQGVEVKLEDNIVTVKGPRGVLTQKLPAWQSASASRSSTMPIVTWSGTNFPSFIYF
jgi:large subunit ribosomal protein L6